MKAQNLYDLREEFAFCSGSDLHNFFRNELGDPSPSGRVNIDQQAAAELVNDSLDTMAANNGGSLDGLYTEAEVEKLRESVR